MALPPQLIGIKRRRHDEPVDLLYLEQDRSSHKRRFTDFVFQRVGTNHSAHSTPSPQPNDDSQVQRRFRSASNYTTEGAPVVQATSPGAEYRHAFQRRTILARIVQQQQANLASGDDVTPGPVDDEPSRYPDAGPAKLQHQFAARRFHLSRSNIAQASLKHSGGIRKHKTHPRSHLATFVERHVDRLSGGELQFFTKSVTIDRLIGDDTVSPQPLSMQNGASAAVAYSPKRIQSFVKAPAELTKTGNSIRDHPSTWDHDSDQLANELAAFAMEIGEEDEAGEREQQPMETLAGRTPEIVDPDMDADDTFVYETYLRLPRTELSPITEGKVNSIGMLVIEEQDEELWKIFAEDEEDSEWDEEDADSNAEDNPCNDYPEDEVSSEDEHGRSAYKYRRGASDDEEYDLGDSFSADDENEVHDFLV